MTIALHARVRVAAPVPALGLPAGGRGVVVDLADGSTAVIEFIGDDGQTIGEAFVHVADLDVQQG